MAPAAVLDSVADFFGLASPVSAPSAWPTDTRLAIRSIPRLGR